MNLLFQRFSHFASKLIDLARNSSDSPESSEVFGNVKAGGGGLFRP